MEPSLDLDSLQRAVDALRVQQESVQQERQQLETMKASVDGNIEQFKQRVKLNVGGSKFETTLSTLTRHRNMKPCSEMLLEVTVYCGKVRDQRGCLIATEHSL